MSESHAVESEEQRHHLLTTSNDSENIPSTPRSHEQANAPTSQPQFTIPRKPLPRYTYTAVPTESEDIAIPQIDRKRLAWRPFYLRLPVLCGFLLFFCILIVILETIYQVSRQRQGLVGSKQNLHYLWTYGPSAVLIVTAAFWARVEYQLKELTPWHAMAGKETEAQKSVLLDYVSAFQPVSIYVALRNSHYAVASVAACSLLLRVLIVFSTALLILTPIQKSYENAPFVLTTALKGSGTDLSRANTLPFFMLNGVMQQGLQYPFGVTPDLAYQTFNSSILTRDSELSATVEALAGELECEKAQLTVNSWYGAVRFGDLPGVAWGVNGQMDFTAGDCHISDVLIDTIAAPFYKRDSNQSTDYVAIYRPGYCGKSTSEEDGRIVLAAAAVELGQSQNGSITYMNTTFGNTTRNNVPYYFTYTNFTMKMSTNFICRPKIVLGTAKARFNSSQASTTAAQWVSTSNTAVFGISNLSGWDFARTQWDTINSGPLSVTVDGIKPPTKIQFWNATTKLPEVDTELLLGMLQIGMPFDATANLTYDQNLVGAAQKYFKVLTALYTHLSLAQSQSVPTNGTVQTIEDRLEVKELSVRVMEGVLVLIVILNIQIIIFVRRVYAVPRSPSTMISFATLMHQSRSLMTLLEGSGSGAIRTPEFEKRLNGRPFISGIMPTNNGTSFCIQVGEGKQLQDRKTSKENNSTKKHPTSWRPFIIGLWGRMCACASLLLILVLLEILLALSQRNHGLSDASYHDSVHYVWAYVPATILVLLSLWFSAIDFDIRCLGPYFDLQKSTSASRSIGLSYLDALSSTTLAKAIKRRHSVVFVTALAAIVASNLTIAVSGLYVISTQPRNFTIQLQAESIFTSDWRTLRGADNSATTAGLVLFANLSSPAWTYEELAFPQLSMVTQDNSPVATLQGDKDGKIKTRLTATRSNLVCQLHDKSDMTINVSNTKNGYQYFFNISIPNELCGTTTRISAQANDSMYVGFWQHLMTDNCDQSFYIWGHVRNAQDYSLTAMFCNETFHEVEADVTLIGPSLAISDSEPPVEIDSTLRPSNAFKVYDESFNQLTGIRRPNNTAFNGIFLAVVYGRDGIPIEDIGDPQKQLTVVDRIKRVNGLMRAQYFGQYLRNPVGAASKPAPFNATYTQMNRLRLVQDPIATRVLDGLLALTLICTIVGLLAADTRDVVPRNPCSIAAKASFLADSSLVRGNLLPNNCQQMSNKELEAHVKDMRFRMGWFDREGGGRVYKLDVVEPGEELARLTERPKTR